MYRAWVGAVLVRVGWTELVCERECESLKRCACEYGRFRAGVRARVRHLRSPRVRHGCKAFMAVVPAGPEDSSECECLAEVQLIPVHFLFSLSSDLRRRKVSFISHRCETRASPGTAAIKANTSQSRPFSPSFGLFLLTWHKIYMGTLKVGPVMGENRKTHTHFSFLGSCVRNFVAEKTLTTPGVTFFSSLLKEGGGG